MSRVRRKMVTTGALVSKKLARIDPLAELVYWRVHLASDNFGTMRGDPWDVWQLAFPGKLGVDEAIVEVSLETLVGAALLQRWTLPAGEHEGTWIHVLGHDKHQSYEFIRKRGTRHSPVPPEYEGVPTPPQGRPTAGTDASACVPVLGRTDAAPSTSTSKSTTTPRDAAVRAHEGAPAHEAPPIATPTGSTSSMIERIIDNLVAASAPGMHRSVWEDYLDQMLLDRPDTPIQRIATVAARMKARVDSHEGLPFNWSQGVSHFERGLRIEATDDHKFGPKDHEQPTTPGMMPDAAKAELLALRDGMAS